ncbi:MAG: hypothetical protein K8L99_09030 [Anaerolineae bacterium]|nr:hypothetical protein [Anaerolineae bacterium]
MYRQHGSLNKIGHALGVSEAIVKYHARAAGLQVVCILVDEEQLAEVEEVVS